MSAPISFTSLHSKALLLDRIDFDGESNVDVIRVPLPDAVRFVIDLEKREDAFHSGAIGGAKHSIEPTTWASISETCPNVFPKDGDGCDSRQTWADKHIADAEKHS